VPFGRKRESRSREAAEDTRLGGTGSLVRVCVRSFAGMETRRRPPTVRLSSRARICLTSRFLRGIRLLASDCRSLLARLWLPIAR